MKPKIALITILAGDVTKMVQFYREVLGFAVELDSGQYVEFQSEGVRFAICDRSVLENTTGHPSYKESHRGHTFELAFPVDSPAAVDTAYAEITARGATPIKAPANMPWGQRTAFFADPEGNIHELFAGLPAETEEGL